MCFLAFLGPNELSIIDGRSSLCPVTHLLRHCKVFPIKSKVAIIIIDETTILEVKAIITLSFQLMLIVR